jgi:hypothetical protein
VSKPSSSTVDPVSLAAADTPPDSTDAVPTEETDSTSDQDPEPINPPKEPAYWVKLNHPPRQLLGNLNKGRRLRSRIINPSDEVANQVTYNFYLAQFEPKKVKQHSNKRSMPTCHYCGIIDHIRPKCPQLQTRKKKAQRKLPTKTTSGTLPSARHQVPRHQRRQQRFVPKNTLRHYKKKLKSPIATMPMKGC